MDGQNSTNLVVMVLVLEDRKPSLILAHLIPLVVKISLMFGVVRHHGSHLDLHLQKTAMAGVFRRRLSISLRLWRLIPPIIIVMVDLVYILGATARVASVLAVAVAVGWLGGLSGFLLGRTILRHLAVDLITTSASFTCL
jgi:hypothetical protein